MALLQCSTAVRDARNDAGETAVGSAPIMRWYNGTMPANCAAASAGTLVAQGTLPSDWMAASSSGVKAKSGTWTVTGQSGAGNGTPAQYWRLFDSTGTTCHYQGPIGPGAGPTQAGTWSAGSASVTLSGANAYIVPGMTAAASGIQAGTVVATISGTALVLSQNALVAGSGTTITFSADCTVDNPNIANAQVATYSSFSITDGNA